MDIKELLKDGYKDGMTADEIVEALKTAKYVPNDYVEKKHLDKASSEAAEWKKKYNETLSEAQKAQMAEAERIKQLEDSVNQLETAKKEQEFQLRVTQTAKGFLAQGFKDEQASEAAKAFHSGDVDKFNLVHSAFLKEYGQQAVKTNLNTQPNMPSGSLGETTDVVSYAKFKGMNYQDRADFMQNSPELFKKYNDGIPITPTK